MGEILINPFFMKKNLVNKISIPKGFVKLVSYFYFFNDFLLYSFSIHSAISSILSEKLSQSLQ